MFHIISLSADPPSPLPGALTLRPRNAFLQPRDQDGNHAGASGVKEGDRRRVELYA